MVSTVSLFVFSISFFSLMSDAGIFDIIVNRLTKAAGKNITAIMIATALIAVVGHLDGSGATTYIITTTAMLPIFKRMNLDKRALMLITSLAIGVMNLVPWGGPTMRAATVLEMTPSDLWTPLIPVQGLMLFFLLVVAFLQGRIATRNQAKISENAAASEAELTSAPETAKSPAWKLAVNYILTLAVLVVLVLDLLPAAFVFMLGLSIGLIVNIPDLKKQNQKLKEYGTAAMSMVVTLFSAGVFTGVLKNTGILDNMATAIVGLIPTALGPYTHFIVAFLAVPLIMCLGTDAFYYGLLPVVIGVCGNFGVSAEVVAHTLLIAENVGVTISPLTPAVFLGLGVLDLELGEHIKYSIRWIWPVSILSVLAAVLVGVIPV
ncbi:Citrate transporter [Faecalibacterium prausnitzii]|nr:Citrate transporter [Faecalibacterium prausnitzii]